MCKLGKNASGENLKRRRRPREPMGPGLFIV